MLFFNTFLSVDTSRIDYMAAKERLIKIIELNDREFDFNYWHELRNPSKRAINNIVNFFSRISFTSDLTKIVIRIINIKTHRKNI